MIFSKTYEPRIWDKDRRGRLSFRSVLEILEDIASWHSRFVKDKTNMERENNMAWIFSEWEINVRANPSKCDKLYVDTWVTGKIPSIVTIRKFAVKNQAGEIILTADAKIALVDITSGKLVRITDEIIGIYEPEPLVENAETVKFMREIKEDYSDEIKLHVRNADIDINEHVHNTVYMDYIYEILPSLNEASTVKISYVKAIKKGSDITVKHLLSDKHYIGIYLEDGLLSTLAEII